MKIVIVILLSVTLSDMARANHDMPVYHVWAPRTVSRWYGWQTIITSVVPLSDKPCIFQSKTSPPEGNSLQNVAQSRIAKDLRGPVDLLNACRAMRTRLGANQCQKIFVGGHGSENGVGVGDLFEVYSANTASTTQARYQQMLNSQRNPNTADNAARVARTALVNDQRPCARWPRMANPVMDQILSCFETLIDRSNINNAIVFSSCGPKTRTPCNTALQRVCAQVLSDATNIPVVYSNSYNCTLSGAGNYDTCEAGHSIVRPTYNRP